MLPMFRHVGLSWAPFCLSKGHLSMFKDCGRDPGSSVEFGLFLCLLTFWISLSYVDLFLSLFFHIVRGPVGRWELDGCQCPQSPKSTWMGFECSALSVGICCICWIWSLLFTRGLYMHIFIFIRTYLMNFKVNYQHYGLYPVTFMTRKWDHSKYSQYSWRT